MTDKRVKMTEEDIEAAAVEAMRLSLGGADTDVGHARLRNLEAYNAEPVGAFAPPEVEDLSLIHISEPTRPVCSSRMPSSA